MTLAEKLLPKLSEWHPDGPGRHSLSVSLPENGWSVHLVTDKTDSLSCLVWELALIRTSSPPEELTVRTWAERIATRVTGLLEPLKVLEVDDTRGEALLRSTTPAQKEGQVAYYEVKLLGTSRAEARRYAAGRTTSGRHQIAFALTHEVLAKLVSDLAG